MLKIIGRSADPCVIPFIISLQKLKGILFFFHPQRLVVSSSKVILTRLCCDYKHVI